MSDTTSLAETLLALFTGRVGVYAEAMPTGGFRPVERDITTEDLSRHLVGERCVGLYLVSPGDTVSVTACDWDSAHEADWWERAAAVHATLAEYGLASLLELSQSGAGAHVWVRFERPVAASAARQWWRDVLAAASVECRELYPRQDTINDNPRKLGSQIRYPLWRESRFVSPARATIEPGRALASWTALEFGGARYVIPETTQVNPQPDSLLADLPPRLAVVLASGKPRRAWETSVGVNDKSRSGAAMRLVCSLVRAHVPTDEIDLGLIAWGRQHGAEDKTERRDWRRRTIDAAYDYVLRESTVSPDDHPPRSMRDCVVDFIATRDRGGAGYCPFGVLAVDEKLEGLGYGELGLLAGRPSRGKTALAIQWAETQTRRGVAVLFISEEMSPRALGGRMLLRAYPGGGSDAATEDSPEVRAYFEGKAPLMVRSNCCTLTNVDHAIRAAMDRYGVRAVVVDYVQLLRGASRTSRVESLAEVSTGLRQLSLECDLAILAAAQLNRNIEARSEGFTPSARMSDLRDCGQFEQDADLILAVHRPWWDDKAAPPTDLRIQQVKRRNGPMRFRELQVYYNQDAQIIS